MVDRFVFAGLMCFVVLLCVDFVLWVNFYWWWVVILIWFLVVSFDFVFCFWVGWVGFDIGWWCVGLVGGGLVWLVVVCFGWWVGLGGM